jgi:hypothetical protein
LSREAWPAVESRLLGHLFSGLVRARPSPHQRDAGTSRSAHLEPQREPGKVRRDLRRIRAGSNLHAPVVAPNARCEREHGGRWHARQAAAEDLARVSRANHDPVGKRYLCRHDPALDRARDTAGEIRTAQGRRAGTTDTKQLKLEDFRTPEYAVTARPLKPWIVAGESAQVRVGAAHYSGIPAVAAQDGSASVKRTVRAPHTRVSGEGVTSVSAGDPVAFDTPSPTGPSSPTSQSTSRFRLAWNQCWRTWARATAHRRRTDQPVLGSRIRRSIPTECCCLWIRFSAASTTIRSSCERRRPAATPCRQLEPRRCTSPRSSAAARAATWWWSSSWVATSATAKASKHKDVFLPEV